MLRLKRSAIVFAALGTAIRLGANILLLPLILLTLSQEEQALWWVFVALGNFSFLADLGFAPAIVRVYNFFWAGADDFETEGLKPATGTEPNYPKIRQLHATVCFLFKRLSLGAVLILAVVGSLLLYKPIQAGGEPGRLWLTWLLYLLFIWFNILSSQWTLALQGINQLREMHRASLFSSLSYLIVAGSLLSNGWGLSAMVVAIGVRGIVLRAIARRAFCKTIPGIQNSDEPAELTILSRLWPNARKFAILALGSYFVTSTSVLISAHFLGPDVTASLGLTVQIGGFIAGFATLWTGVKWSEITILRTQDRSKEMAVLFFRRFLLVLATFSILAVLVVLFGDVILEWKDTKTRLLPTPYLVFFLTYLGLQTFYAQLGNLVLTQNVVPFFKISISTGIGVVILSVLFTWAFGLWGLLLAPFVVEWLYSGWFTTRLGFRSQPLPIRETLKVALRIP